MATALRQSRVIVNYFHHILSFIVYFRGLLNLQKFLDPNLKGKLHYQIVCIRGLVSE